MEILIYLTPLEEILQDISQSEVTIPSRMNSPPLCVSSSKLSLTLGSIFVSSFKIILASVCSNKV